MWPVTAFCAARDAFGDFQIFNIKVIWFIHPCLKMLVNKFQTN